jgi:alginate O-acetyltransferase complex protein AlgI
MVAQCIAAWGFSLLIEKYRERKAIKVFTFLSIAISLSGLLYFKYANFFILNINNLAGSNFQLIRLLMPIGISFYTFQLISYTMDLYWNKIEVQRNLLDFSTYVASFPQLIAGPIVRYSEVAKCLKSRIHSLPGFAMGSRRFIIGLGKKMLLANLFGELVEIYKLSGDQSVLFVWIYLVAYTLHIYFDFSGYSDMAIGLGHVFGFKFPENFNYPYIAESITGFWRRWHMTLSLWFRDYVYIPLGGNRVKKIRFIFNILLVWMVTGFWHGADWNFILWGGYFGVVLLLEKLVFGNLLGKSPRPVRHVYVMLMLFMSWAFFDALSFHEAFGVLGRMYGVSADALVSNEALYYLRSYAVPFVIGIVGSTPIIRGLALKLDTKKVAATILEPVALACILIFSTAAMVDGSFNPFIYFRF